MCAFQLLIHQYSWIPTEFSQAIERKTKLHYNESSQPPSRNSLHPKPCHLSPPHLHSPPEIFKFSKSALDMFWHSRGVDWETKLTKRQCSNRGVSCRCTEKKLAYRNLRVMDVLLDPCHIVRFSRLWGPKTREANDRMERWVRTPLLSFAKGHPPLYALPVPEYILV